MALFSARIVEKGRPIGTVLVRLKTRAGSVSFFGLSDEEWSTLTERLGDAISVEGEAPKPQSSATTNGAQPHRRPMSPRECNESPYWADMLAGKKPQLTDEPQAGYYQRRLVKGGPFVSVRFYWAQDIEDGELVSEPVLRCAVDGREAKDGKPIDPGDHWLSACTHPITEADYRFKTDTAVYARNKEPSMPEASPRKPVNVNELPAIEP